MEYFKESMIFVILFFYLKNGVIVEISVPSIRRETMRIKFLK